MNQSGDQRGFTLIEIIVTILVSAVLAVALTQVLSGQTWRSYRPLQSTTQTLLLQRALENITADHARLLRYDPAALVSLQQRVAKKEYWDAATPIQVQDNYCLTLDADATGAAGESNKSPKDSPCDASRTLLKITLKLENQTLTALFNSY